MGEKSGAARGIQAVYDAAERATPTHHDTTAAHEAPEGGAEKPAQSSAGAAKRTMGNGTEEASDPSRILDLMQDPKRNPKKWQEDAELIAGKCDKYGGDESSADLALCNDLAFWCHKDPQLMDACFRRTGLMRPKWDERRGTDTYGERTIAKAIADTPNTYDPQGGGRADVASTTSTGGGTALKLVDITDVTGENVPELPPAIIEGLWRPCGKLILVGPPKAGKSMEAIHLALCIATGREWLGRKCHMYHVLYVNVEISEAEFANRVDCARKHMGLAPYEFEGRFKMVTLTGKRNAEGKRYKMPELVNELIPAHEEYPFDVCVIDPIYKLEDGDENTADGTNDFLAEMDRLNIDTGCATMYVHHTGKGGAGNRSVWETGRGSSNFANDAYAVVSFEELYLSPKANEAAWDEMLHMGIADPSQAAYRIRFGTRGFQAPPSVYAIKRYPFYEVDEDGILDGCEVRGSDEAKRAQGSQRTSERFAKERERKSAAIGAAVNRCEADGVPATRENVFERLNSELRSRELPDVTFETFRSWTRGSSEIPWRVDQDNGNALHMTD